MPQIIKRKRGICQTSDNAPCSFNQCYPGSDIPLVLGTQTPRSIGQACGHQCKLVRNRSHGSNDQVGMLKAFPVSAFEFCAAGEYKGSCQVPFLTSPNSFAIICDARLQGADEGLTRGRIADAPSNCPTVFHQPYGHAPLRNSSNEFARPIYRINHPDAMFFHTLKVIHTFLRKPPLPVPNQNLPKDLVHDRIRLSDRATVRSLAHFYGAWNEGRDCANGCLQRFSYASKSFCSRRIFHG